ncbi:MAG: 2Fe-2S iron-sulfur cluster binding domain-containing protein, partial [Planctomycetes bacterium]|nr:2Fe-2S iron-sulfur cluster binding domain-containing protein [Planctomycetota bacterium]
MFSVIIAVAVISSIGAALALLLVISERFIADYGECRIDINGEKELTVAGGKPLLDALSAEKIFIPSACGGRGTCGVCKVKVHQGAGAILPTETPFLDDDEKQSNVRLSCQVKVRRDLRIEIPPELFLVKEYACLCADIRDLTYDMKAFRLKLTDPESIDFIAGQYVQLLCPRYKGSGEEVYRAYSLASDPARKDTIELVIRRVPNGICTTYCFDHLKVGDAVKVNGPYGDFRLSDTDAPMIFIAGGSGMAPFLSILSEMVNSDSKREVIYFFGGNQVRDLCYLDEMKNFESRLDNFHFVPVVAVPEKESNWSGETGLVTEAVQRNFSDVSRHEAYLCGSPGMIDA